MPRNGQGVYSLPPVYEAVTGETIQAQQHNTPLEDIAFDLNQPRPIPMGGTGGQSATQARSNLGVYSKAEVDALTKDADTKTTPVDADGMVITDSADSGKTKRVLWSRIKAVLKSYFDGLYLSLGGGTLTGTLTLSGSNQNINNDANRVIFFRDASGAEQGYLASFTDNSIRLRANSAGVSKTWVLQSDGTTILPNEVPTLPYHAASKGYVDGAVSAVAATADGKVSKTGDTMTGTLNGTSISMSGPVSGTLQHADQGGYLLIGSFGSSYGSGQARVWWNNNDGILTVQPPSSGSTPTATINIGQVLVGTPTLNNHAARLADLNSGLATKFNNPTGTTAQYLRGNGSPATMDKAAVGLGSVDNTSDVNKPISTATQTYVDNGLAGKANTSHTHTAAQITNFNAAVDARVPAYFLSDLVPIGGYAFVTHNSGTYGPGTAISGGNLYWTNGGGKRGAVVNYGTWVLVGYKELGTTDSQPTSATLVKRTG